MNTPYFLTFVVFTVAFATYQAPLFLAWICRLYWERESERNDTPPDAPAPGGSP